MYVGMKTVPLKFFCDLKMRTYILCLEKKNYPFTRNKFLTSLNVNDKKYRSLLFQAVSA